MNRAKILELLSQQKISVEEAIKRFSEADLFKNDLLSIKNKFEENGREIFEYQIIHGDFITRDHRVHKVGLIPGVTFLDLIYRCLREKNIDLMQVEIRNVLFKEPIATDEMFDKQIRVIFEKKNNQENINLYRARVISKKIKNGKSFLDNWDENTTATIEVNLNAEIDISKIYSKKIELTELIDQSEKQYDMEDLYDNVRKIDIVHKDFMKALGKVYVGENYILAKLELGDLAKEYKDQFYIHPVYLDSSTLLPFLSPENSEANEKKAYIPMTINRFVSRKHFGQDSSDVYAYVELKENQLINSGGKDVYVNDIEYYDGEGKLIALAEGVSVKQIRNAELIGRLVKRDNHDFLIQDEQKKAKQITQKISQSEQNILVEIQNYIEEKLERKLDDKELQLGFYDLGLDSNQLLDISLKIEDRIGSELYPTLLFEYPNVRALASYFEENYEDKFNIVGTKGESVRKMESDWSVVNGEVLKQAQVSQSDWISENKNDDVAIIGLAGHYPDSKGLNEFWENIKNGKNCIREIPQSHWNYRDSFEDNKKPTPNKTYSKWGSFLEDADKFDPLFFRISPLEAESLDPQVRLMLETAWETVEDAGYTPNRLNKNKVGVYVGVMNSDYAWVAADAFKDTGNYLSPGFYAHEIANRISYFMNFQGPSLTVQTACSSSLSAIHMARKAIQSGECDVAIAGGVNLSLHSSKYIMLSQMGILSPEGKEKTFDATADGYVPGEGVGAVLLKKLSQAVKDGDHIYGVIKGSAINHSGMGGGHHVPGVKPLSEVFDQAMKESDIDPRRIEYIETHGTGTNLGDPIEISALSNILSKHTKEKEFCALGSKANIGHLESASGICSLTKVLMAIKNKVIPKCANIENENNKLNLLNTPFVINKESRAWISKSPRVAGINSFGVGGSNSFLLLEEYIDLSNKHIELNTPQIIILSAKNIDRLNEYVNKYQEFITEELTKPNEEQINLQDIAYVLQVGREIFEERFAIVVSSKEELKQKLDEYLKNPTSVTGIYLGNPKNSKEKENPIYKDYHSKILNEIIENNYLGNEFKNKLEIICDLFTKGFSIDFNLLYDKLSESERPRRISLPTYPFSKKRYWISAFVPKSVHINGAIKELHPMIDENKSTMKGQSFSKVFNGKEFYLKDHVVGDQNVLPGVAYLEMARAAGEISSEAEIKEIRNVIWAKPIVVGKENVEAKVNLVSKESNVLGYEVITSEGKHSQGEVIFGKELPGIAKKINIEDLISKCNQSVGPEEIYKGFLEIGLDYDKTFQSIIELRANTEIAIAKLKISDQIKETTNQFGLHPSLMDGALQSVAGLVFTQKRFVNDPEKILMLPFGLKSLKIFKPFSEECYVIVKASVESLQSTDRAVKKFDITVTDKSGEVIVEFKGFSVREMKADILKNLGNTKETIPHTKAVLAKIEGESGNDGALYFEPYWEKRSLESDVSSIYNDYLNEDKYQIVIIDSVQEMDSVISKLKLGNVYKGIVWKLNSQSLEKDIEDKALGIFRLTKALIESKPKDKIWLINVHHGAAIDESLAGFAKTLRLENPKFEYRNLNVPIDTSESELNQILNKEIGHIYSEIKKKEKGSIEIRYVKEKDVLKRAVKLIQEQQVLGNETLKNYSFKEDGLYLITGGAGGLGLIFAKYLCENYKGNIILLGRSELSDEKSKKLEALNRLGGKATYVTADISKYDEIVTAVRKGKEQLNLVVKENNLEAILHCAGVIQDAFIIKKTEDQFREVITPKIVGTNNIQKLSELEHPRLIVLFSSIASVMGNLGQCDYALGNAYMDAIANEQALNTNTKYVSINWPLWREGGMLVSKEVENIMLKSTGMKPLEINNGIKAFENIIKLPSINEMTVIQGDRLKISQFLQIKDNNLKGLKNVTDNKINELNQILADIKHIASDLMKIDIVEIDELTDLKEYGLDSILLMQIINKIEEHFSVAMDITEILNFSTLTDFSEYIFKLKSEAGLKNQTQTTNLTSENIKTHNIKNVYLNKKESSNIHVSDRFKKFQKMAIVGMAGRFPGSTNIEHYWDNLINSKELVTEAPYDRFLKKDWYSSDPKERGKSVSNWGGFLDNVDAFDAKFFKFKDIEAINLDPQQRIMMELSQELFDSCGYSRSDLKNTNTGVFIGCTRDNYFEMACPDNLKNENFAFSMVGNISNLIGARISDIYDFKGPSYSVDTACSSSLVALNNACQSILTGECEQAVVGGVCVLTSSDVFVSFSQMGALSPRGKSNVFDLNADGFVMGEGAGLIFIKPLEKAIADGDQIKAVILATAVNNDGKSMGITTPNKLGQKAVIARAIENAQIDPSSIGYLEAHGTGTMLGDPIEVKAASEAYRELIIDPIKKNANQFCGIGSVNSNIGHLLTAKGVASLIKTILAINHQLIPPTINCNHPHPRFKFEESPFYPVLTPTKWEVSESLPLRRAAINGFGFGGTNAHVILEEFNPEHYNVNYKLKRNPLPKTKFNRMRYWYGKKIEAVDIPEFVSSEKENVSNVQVIKHAEVKETKPLLTIQKTRSVNTNVETAVRDQVSKVISEKINIPIDQIDIQANFLELGLDSVMLMTMVKDFETQYQIELYPTDLFEYQTIDALSKYLSEKFSDQIYKVLSNVDNVVIDIEKSVLNELIDVISLKLNLKAGDLDRDTNFLELGLDSVQLMQMVKDLETKYSIELYPTDLFEYQTINALSKYFVEKYGIQITKYLMGQNIINNKSVEQPKLTLAQFNFDKEKTVGHEVIFITGATGILGAHVLTEILKNTEHFVICLVRAESIEKAWKRIGEAVNYYDIKVEQLKNYQNRISVLLGSIDKDLLGLPNENYVKASDLTTAVFHCAADTDLFKSYEKLLNTNVTGTKNVIDYTHKTKYKKIFHISSWSVMGHKSKGLKSVFAEYNLDVNQEFPFGYQKAKAEAEKLFYENTNADLNWLILRVGNIFPDSRNMNFFYNEKGLNSYYLRLIQLMISLEYIYPLKFEFDITPVDYLSKTMIDLLKQKNINQTVLHVSSSDRKSTNFYFGLKRLFGMKIKIINKNKFEELLRNKSIETGDALADKYLPLLIGHFDKMNHNYLRYSNKLTQKKLGEIKLLLPKFDFRYFIKLILKLSSIDYISVKSIKLNSFGKILLTLIDRKLLQEYSNLINTKVNLTEKILNKLEKSDPLYLFTNTEDKSIKDNKLIANVSLPKKVFK